MMVENYYIGSQLSPAPVASNLNFIHSPIHRRSANSTSNFEKWEGGCKAANWKLVGQTKGRSRQDQYSTMSVPVKDIYL